MAWAWQLGLDSEMGGRFVMNIFSTNYFQQTNLFIFLKISHLDFNNLSLNILEKKN